jgi:hypothetical protein
LIEVPDLERFAAVSYIQRVRSRRIVAWKYAESRQLADERIDDDFEYVASTCFLGSGSALISAAFGASPL